MFGVKSFWNTTLIFVRVMKLSTSLHYLCKPRFLLQLDLENDTNNGNVVSSLQPLSGIDINVMNDPDESAVHRAAAGSNVRLVKLLWLEVVRRLGCAELDANVSIQIIKTNRVQLTVVDCMPSQSVLIVMFFFISIQSTVQSSWYDSLVWSPF